MPKKQMVIAKLTVLNSPQRLQYKPYSFNLEPENVYVELPLDDANVVSVEEGRTVISLEGLGALLELCANEIDEVQGRFELRDSGIQRHGKR